MLKHATLVHAAWFTGHYCSIVRMFKTCMQKQHWHRGHRCSICMRAKLIYACHVNIKSVLRANAVCGDSTMQLHEWGDHILTSILHPRCTIAAGIGHIISQATLNY